MLGISRYRRQCGGQERRYWARVHGQVHYTGTEYLCGHGPVPAEKLLRVEHISGTFAVGTGDVVDRIRAIDVFGQEAYLPIHVASRELNFGGALGRARDHQFGSPVRMYIEATTRAITVRGDANVAGVLTVSIIGQLLDL